MSLRQAFHRFTIGLCTVLSIAGLLVTIFWFRLAESGAPVRGSIRLDGLDLPVRVQIDTFGIPYVFSAGEEDLLRALGYLHASDRLWQMVFLRRVAAGRLAEIFGPRLLSTDRFVRTLDLWGAASRAAARLTPDERKRLEAYAAGVNARLEAREQALPLEFALLRFTPDPWDPRSSLAIGMVMNLDLSHWRRDLSRFWAAGHLSPEKAAYLARGYPTWGPTILAGPVRRSSGFTPGRPDPTPGARPVAEAAGVPVPLQRRIWRSTGLAGGPGRWPAFEVLETITARSASNAWVVSAGRSASGHPLLANDMHLALRAPAIWYLAALHADSADYHVVGLTLPGVPGIVVGHNRSVAWGFTNGMVDDTDFAIETLSEDGRRYLEKGRWQELATRAETIRVRNAEPEILTVRETVRGPLVSDVLPGLDADLSAVWVAARVEGRTTGLWDMGRATDLASFDRALRGFTQPHQNVVFASTEGRIGYRLGGSIPIRGGWDGSVPVPAERMGEGFHGFWPPSSHPAGSDPASGFYASANNLQAPDLGTAISADYAAPFRAWRITEQLSDRADWSVEAFEELQRDTYSQLAQLTLPLALRTARRMNRHAAAAQLESWNGRVDTDSRGAPLFYAWIYRLRSLIAADEYAPDLGWSFFPMKSFLAVLEEGDANPWVDDVSTPATETLDELAERALSEAIEAVGQATWGELHRERHAHPLGRSAWLQRLFAFDLGPYPSPGGPHTVRPDDYRRWAALDSSSWSPPWLSEYGPSERFVADVGPEGPVGRFLIPTGQSGNPFSPHYRDLNERWRSGELIQVPIGRESTLRRGVRRLNLLPSRRTAEAE